MPRGTVYAAPVPLGVRQTRWQTLTRSIHKPYGILPSSRIRGPALADEIDGEARGFRCHRSLLRQSLGGLERGGQDVATENYVSMLTHLARATLSDAGVLPRSRPELADQLRQIGEVPLADRLADALVQRYG